MTIFGLPVAQQATAGSRIDRSITPAQSDHSADRNDGIHDHDRCSDECDRHKARHQKQDLLHNDGGDACTFLDFAGEHRTAVARMESVVTAHVFVEKAHVEAITDARSKSTDGDEPVKTDSVRNENRAAECYSERHHEGGVVEPHALQHATRDAVVFDRVGIGERRKKWQHGSHPADCRKRGHSGEQLEQHKRPALATIQQAPDGAYHGHTSTALPRGGPLRVQCARRLRVPLPGPPHGLPQATIQGIPMSNASCTRGFERQPSAIPRTPGCALRGRRAWHAPYVAWSAGKQGFPRRGPSRVHAHAPRAPWCRCSNSPDESAYTTRSPARHQRRSIPPDATKDHSLRTRAA